MRQPQSVPPRHLGFVFLVSIAALAGAGFGQAETHPVRHDTAVAGHEFLVLRHQILLKGSHNEFYRISRAGVWPLFEKIGTRVVGQWEVIGSDGEGAFEDRDEGYRLARYRSFNHWQATRDWRTLAGDGDDAIANEEALAERNQLLRGSREVIYLEGEMAQGGPYFFPPLEETYTQIEDG